MGEKYNKLVRDSIPQILDKKGVHYEKRIATKEEYGVALHEKLREETNEFLVAKTAEELADVLEVIEALKKLSEYSEAENLKLKKQKERGSFTKRIILKGEKE